VSRRRGDAIDCIAAQKIRSFSTKSFTLAERAAANGTLGNQGKPAFHLV